MSGRSARKEYASLAVVGGVLAAAVWLARSHADTLKQFIDEHAIQGVVVYIFLNVLDAVVAPGATLPLIPRASMTSGS